MKDLHCPNCGTPFVRATSREGTVERVLGRMNVFPFRCQLCTNRFRAFWSGARENTLAFDRRQYKRLPTSIEAQFLTDSNLRATNRITEISMGGCTLQTTSEVARGTFLELSLKPASGEEPITIESAMVSSVRPSSMGVRFLEIEPRDKQRLSQIVLGLLVSNSHHPTSSM
jgi:c-di-GMP-binding flagellar brake protein YcgR